MFNRPNTTQTSDRRRRRSALLLTLLLHFSGAVSLMAVGSDQYVEGTNEDVVLVEFIEETPRAAPAAAGPPKASTAPAPRATAKPTPRPATEPDPPPEEAPTPDLSTLSTLWKAAAPASATVSDAIDGDAVNPGGSGGGGVTPNGSAGCPPGQICDGVQEVGASSVTPKRRVRPKYPTKAKALNLDETTCEVRFTIDTRGKPIDVQVSGCPEVFHEEVRRAGHQWLFYKVRGPNGQPIMATFTLSLTFRLR